MKSFKDVLKEKEDERKRKYEEELLKGPQHWWDTWEYNDYKKLLKEKRKLEEELVKYKKRESLRNGKNVK